MIEVAHYHALIPLFLKEGVEKGKKIKCFPVLYLKKTGTQSVVSCRE
jgi:hypothetical protein